MFQDEILRFVVLLEAVADALFSAEVDDELLLHLFLLSFGCLLYFPEKRNPSVFQQRCCWESYTELHMRRGTLDRRLRMSKESFDQLLEYIKDDLAVDELMARPRGVAIIPELCLFCTLRYLSGASYLDVCDITGISKSSFYRVLWKTITAIVKCKQLELKFPSTRNEYKAAAVGFRSISEKNAIVNCVGVVDGYLLRIRVPAKSVVGNQQCYFSGHYQCHGINVQAVADHHSRFLYFACAAPGVTADRDAITQCSLHGLVEGLPLGFCIIGDPAYEATERMVTMFSHTDRLITDNDNFNFYASQLRIRVEMAFGMMQAKWGVLQRPITCNIANVSWMAQAIARLHNYVINERLKKNNKTDPVLPQEAPVAETGRISYLPSAPLDENGDPVDIDPMFTMPSEFGGHSIIRMRMVDRVKKKQLKRPPKNKIIRKRKLAETI